MRKPLTLLVDYYFIGNPLEIKGNTDRVYFWNTLYLQYIFCDYLQVGMDLLNFGTKTLPQIVGSSKLRKETFIIYLDAENLYHRLLLSLRPPVRPFPFFMVRHTFSIKPHRKVFKTKNFSITKSIFWLQCTWCEEQFDYYGQPRSGHIQRYQEYINMYICVKLN